MIFFASNLSAAYHYLPKLHSYDVPWLFYYCMSLIITLLLRVCTYVEEGTCNILQLI